jgi:hypothetical protein
VRRNYVDPATGAVTLSEFYNGWLKRQAWEATRVKAMDLAATSARPSPVLRCGRSTAAGCDVVTVQHALGHARATTTLDTYSHLWPTAEDEPQPTSGFLGGCEEGPGAGLSR